MGPLLKVASALAIVASLIWHGPSAQSAPAAPTGVDVTVEDTGFLVSWEPVADARSYQVDNGVETRQVPTGETSFLWEEGAGQYMCFRVRSASGGEYSDWAPADGYVCDQLPGIRFPWPKGTEMIVWQGKKLHGDNFKSIRDDDGNGPFTVTNQNAATSLDLVLSPKDKGDKPATTPTTAVAAGEVLATWANCRVVLVDHHGPDGPLWALYLHLTDFEVKSGDLVNAGTPLGYVRNDNEGPNSQTCANLKSDLHHVHLALIDPDPDNEKAGRYVTLKGRELCRGHEVVELDDKRVIVTGLTTKVNPAEPFKTPC